MLLNIKKWMFLGLLATSQIVSANVWMPAAPGLPADQFVYFFSPADATATFGIFDNSAGIGAGSTPAASFSGYASIEFVQNAPSSNWDVKVFNPTLAASAAFSSQQFQLGWDSPAGWISETGIANMSPNVWTLSFGNAKTLSAFNIALAPSGGSASAVPLPAAAWFFMTGLIGLLAGKRRKI